MSEPFLRPSGAPAWTLCNAKPHREKDLNTPAGAAAREGQAAHEVRAICLAHKRKADEFVGHFFDDVLVSDSMAEIVQQSIDMVAVYDGQRIIETKLSIASSTGETGATGTADLVIIDEASGTLIVDDFKSGSERVDAENNAQLIIYGAAALQHFDLLGEIHTVILRISQPRIYHDDAWIISANELRYRASEIRLIAEKILAAPERMVATPGEKQCRFCKAQAHCPELRDRVAKELHAEFSDSDAIDQHNFNDVPSLDLNALASSYSALKLIRSWCDSVEQRALDELVAGNELHGYKLVAGRRGARTWRDEAAVINELKSLQLTDDVIFTERSLVTPAALDKILKQYPDELARLQGFITQAAAKPAIAPMADRRAAITLAASAEQFDIITTEIHQ